MVPTSMALLDGAVNVVLDGVRHSMARVGTWDERAGDDERHAWYGSEQVRISGGTLGGTRLASCGVFLGVI